MKVMVVDDEELSKDKIVYLLQSSSVSFEIVLTAGNGREALELIEGGELPDVILTDIRMPVMNGLELIEAVKEKYPDIRFIVTSGYADFDYAVKAMKHGVTDYVLKPVKAQDLIPVVEAMRDAIAASGQAKEESERIEAVSRENRRMALEKEIYHLLTDRREEEAEKREAERHIAILRHGFYLIASVKLHGGERSADGELFRELRERFDDEAGNGWMMENYFGKGTFIILFGGEDENRLADTAAREAHRLRALLHDRHGLAVTIGVSRPCGDPRMAYRQAAVALKNRFCSGTDRIFPYAANEVRSNRASQSLALKFKLAEQSLENKSLAKAIVLLRHTAEDVFVRALAECREEISIDYLFNEYVNLVIRFCLKHDYDFIDRIEPDVLSGRVLDELEDRGAILKLIETIIERVFRSAPGTKGGELRNPALNSSVIDQIVAYVSRNIEEEITLQTVSDKFSINPSYLSRVFKAAMNQGFVKYVTGLKIDKAKELLENGALEIADIAHGLGFSDQQYFNRVFKRTTGTTPSEWRTKSKKSPKNA
ncbi:response regulator [Cohnella phaseoli]|uniref:YesN/AraC family two-component response regulator n=1 Tax=Cohnella phaseoli TaxID=456490 RepID=A0A3D9ITH3_9BACL|nr:response regulator [Cohnella phaseoli]RED64416.1 YesN/AraC family two-component response regulator [Cohnella phaseoli]